MEINDLIYKEIETLDLRECRQDEQLAPICNEVCARVLFDKPFDELDADDTEDLNSDLCVAIKRIPVDSLLFNALRWWFRTWDNYKDIAHLIRGGQITDKYLYFGTGYGYDTISSDLLGCKPNGRAREVFLRFCNESETVMDMGGAAYMQSLGYTDDIKVTLTSTRDEISGV